MNEQKDIFDKIMSLPGLRRFYGLYAKYKEVLLQIFRHADRDLCIEKMEIPEEWYREA